MITYGYEIKRKDCLANYAGELKIMSNTILRTKNGGNNNE